MKKTVLPFIAVLLLLLISRSYLNMTKAQPLWVELAVPTEPFHNPPTIQIISPNQNQTVNSPNISLNFSITTPNSWVFNTGPPNDTIRQIWGNITTVSVSLDGNQPHNLTLNEVKVPYLSNSSQNLNFSVPLSWTAGMHSIQVLASGYTYYVLNPLESIQYDLQLASVPVNANATVEFYAALPSPIITNPQNAVYNESMVPLQFTLGSSASWIGYSLDGKANVTITGNTTLTGLTMGEHYLTVYTNDTLGTSYVSQTIDFSIALKDHYVTIAVIAVPVAIVFLITGLLLYRRHRRTAS